MDPLSDVLSLLKPRSYVSGGFDVGGGLSVQFARHEGIKCYAVVSGEGWLSVEDVPDAVRLTTGDCFLLPHGRPFRLATDLTAPPIDALTILATARRNGGVVSINGGGDCFIAGGHFALRRRPEIRESDSMFNWTVALMDSCRRGHRLCLVNDRRITRSYPV